MKNLVQITDYDYNLDYLKQEFKSKDKFKGIIQAGNKQAEDIETAIFEIQDNFNIFTGEGAQLDVIGQIIGISRQGLSDSDYRAVLAWKAGINLMAGTVEGIFTSIKNLMGVTYMEYTPRYPAKIQIWFDDDWTVGEEDLLQDLMPAGVSLLLAYSLVFDDGGFIYLDTGYSSTNHLIAT